MRNLKRALSLVLAVVMVIGLMVVGASAVSYNDFSDRGEIVNKDAVSMLTTLGIIEGQPDGSYNPAGDVDRAQMAKMISVALTNNEDCDTLYQNVNSGLTDISANWARGYINYCYVRGIIAGRGDNTFDPSANVTGVEAAKMLLAALGYNAEIEGLVGPDWALNTAALAQQLGIFRNFTKDVSEPLNRDDAALLIYNALDVEMIQQYSNGYALVYGDHRTILSSVFGVIRVEGVVAGNEWAQLQGTDSDAALREGRTILEDVVWYDSTTANTVVEEGVKETQPVPFNVTTPVEYIGKAVTMYVEKTTILANSKVIGVATNDEMNVINATVETEDTAKDYLKGTGVAVDADTDYYVNYGYYENAEEAIAVINEYANAFYGTNNAKFGLNGIEVEVIDNNDDGTAEYVLYTVETLSQVYRYSERNEELTFYVPDRTNGRLDLTASPVTRDFDDVVFADDVADDDLILYVEYGGRTYVSLPEIVTGTMTRVDRDRDDQLYITVNDETYYQSYIPDAASMVDVDMDHFDIDDARDIPGFDTEYDFILDSNGFVVAVRPAEEVEVNYALVLDSAWTQNALRKEGQLKILKADGTEGTYDINWNKSDDAFEHVTDIYGPVSGDPSDKLEAYLGSRDVYQGDDAKAYKTSRAAGSVITYSLTEDGILTIESVLQGNSLVKDDSDYNNVAGEKGLEIQNINTDSTAGVADNGVVMFLDTNASARRDDCNLQYEISGYTTGSSRLTVSSTDTNYKGADKTYAVDRNTVAFYYWTEYVSGKAEVKYGVATGWDNMSTIDVDPTHVQVYPVLTKTASHTYEASDLAEVILFEAEPQTTTANYMLVLDANAKTKDLWELTVVFEDGTLAAINVDEDDLGEFDPDDNDDFMKAWTYSEKADGNYSIGDMGVSEYGEAYLLKRDTIDFTDYNLASPAAKYWSLPSGVSIWDVSDVERAGDTVALGTFTNISVYTVFVPDDGDSVRTAWIWAKPGQGSKPELSDDIQVFRANAGRYNDVTFYIEETTTLTNDDMLNALLAKMKDDGCTNIDVTAWTDVAIRYTDPDGISRFLMVDYTGTGSGIDLIQVYKRTADGKVSYHPAGALAAADQVGTANTYYTDDNGVNYTKGKFTTMPAHDVVVSTGYYRFVLEASAFNNPATTDITVELEDGTPVPAGPDYIFFAKPGATLTVKAYGSFDLSGTSATFTMDDNAASPDSTMTAKLLYHVEDEDNNNPAGVTTTVGTDTITFTGANGDTVLDFEATFTWTMGDSGVKPELTISNVTDVAP